MNPKPAEVTKKQRTKHQIVPVNGIDIFYREAGDPANQTLLLLHGFPSSSFMFRHYIPQLADKYHCIAPDYPGFGLSSFPDRKEFEYTFENYAKLVKNFLDEKGIGKYSFYLHDYGCTVGLRLALLDPTKVTSLIIQDGNAYQEGLGPQWDTTKKYWENPTKKNKEKLPDWLNKSGTRDQYTAGLPEDQIELIPPEIYLYDWNRMSRPGNVDLQFALFKNYKTNVELYPEFQAFFRQYQPPALVIWGKHDAYFDVDEAYCYQRDLENAELHILDAGHKALETHWWEISQLSTDFLDRNLE